jgi:hypothetical protein
VRKPAIRPTRAIGASCRAGAASGHATAPQPSSVLNSRRFVANSVPGVLNASAGIFSARVQADGCPNWVNRVTLVVGRPLPVFPKQRTSSDRPGMSGGAISGLMRGSKQYLYSITSLARFAVFILKDELNLSG